MVCILNINDFDDAFFEKVRQADEKIFFSDKAGKGKKLSLYGRALLGYMLCNNYGIESFSYRYERKGKPYLKDENLFFSISHSGCYVLCCVSDKECGCDIEKIKEYNPKIPRRFFTEKETAALESHNEKECSFTRIWTLKESVLKKTGDGISGGLDSYCFADYVDKRSFEAFGCCFSCFSLDGYEISVCSSETEKELTVVPKERIEEYISGII
ncbi:MAG: 4'-phosphopantetheinyl transferase superfamily protein [Clostridia bacterium]|nr:4'-phosphopantetheinyl transferase superfamily protein [Clostridia bacterium]